MSWSCLFWVQSLLGTGHLRRGLLIAEALARSDVEVVIANGGLPSPWAIPNGVRLEQLTPITARGVDMADLVDDDGRPVTESLSAHRRDRLSSLAATMRPTVLLTELFPFGRRAFRTELLPLLDTVRAKGGLVAASVRDVLVSKPDASRQFWMRDLAIEHYAAVLVHGEASLFPFGLSFPFAEALGSRLRYTGFVQPTLALGPPTEKAAVVVSAGGGAVGATLLAIAAAARPLTRFADRPWLLVGGSRLPPVARETLNESLPRGMHLVDHRDDLPALAAAAEVSVSQAGYNSVAEGLAGSARMVLVPFNTGHEDEQSKRARRLAELDLATWLPEAGLTAHGLAAAIDAAAERPRPHLPATWFGGAARTAAILADLARGSGRG